MFATFLDSRLAIQQNRCFNCGAVGNRSPQSKMATATVEAFMSRVRKLKMESVASNRSLRNLPETDRLARKVTPQAVETSTPILRPKNKSHLAQTQGELRPLIGSRYTGPRVQH